MTIYALRTSDSKEWVGLDYYDGYTRGIGKTPYLFNEAHESYPVKATQDTGHPCEWVEVDLTVKGEQPVKAALPSLLLAGKLATAARAVTNASAKNISVLVEQMESALDAYDNEIIRISK